MRKPGANNNEYKPLRNSEFGILYSYYQAIQCDVDELSKRKSTFTTVKKIHALKRQQIKVLKVILNKEINKYFN